MNAIANIIHSVNANKNSNEYKNVKIHLNVKLNVIGSLLMKYHQPIVLTGQGFDD